MDNKGWETFDIHNYGSMHLGNLKRCLDINFNKESNDFTQLNQIYGRMATRPLEEFSRSWVVGFKMRLTPPRVNSPFMATFSPYNRLSKMITKWSFKCMMINLLRRNNIVVFLAVRRELLRWGLSEYHGDGSGNPGHLQFKLASGEISRGEIGKVHVDCSRLEAIISKFEESHANKRRLMEEFKLAGIQTHPLCYEEFLTNKRNFFMRNSDYLELDVSLDEIDVALKKGEYFEKVHSDDISDFVENHEEVIKRFGDRFAFWC